MTNCTLNSCRFIYCSTGTIHLNILQFLMQRNVFLDTTLIMAITLVKISLSLVVSIWRICSSQRIVIIIMQCFFYAHFLLSKPNLIFKQFINIKMKEEIHIHNWISSKAKTTVLLYINYWLQYSNTTNVRNSK